MDRPAGAGLVDAPVQSVPQQSVASGSEAGVQRIGHVAVALVADVQAVVPGKPFRVALHIVHDPEWHTYWRVPGDSGLPTQLDWDTTPGVRFGGLQWPIPHRLSIGPMANYGYEGELLLVSQVEPLADGLTPGASLRLQAKASWLVCREVCIPGEAQLTLELPVAERDSAPRIDTDWNQRFEAVRQRVPDDAAAQALKWAVSDSFGRLELPEALVCADGQSGKDGPGVVEFFPYRDGMILPAAVQKLYGPERACQSAGRWVLELALPPADAASAGTAQAPPKSQVDGVLVVDGRPRSVRLEAVASLERPAREVGQARPKPDPTRPPGQDADAVAAQGAGAGGAQGSADMLSVPSGGLGGALLMLLSALLGGVILNLMPCVFPVIGLKVLGFAQPDPDGVRRPRRHALVFSIGVVAGFLVIGLVMLGLRLAGHQVGWGFQLQSPVVVALLALLFVVLGLNLAGLFEMGLVFTRISGPGGGLAGSWWSGVLAVVVAAPCTAPLMGGALGYSMTAPWPVALGIFVALGLGMALPYALLGWFPGWLRHLPRPGPWLETLRQLLSFPMWLTAAWLVWVLGLQTGIDGVLNVLLSAVALAFAGWLLGRSQRRVGGGLIATGLRGVLLAAALAVVVSLMVRMPQAPPASATTEGGGAIAAQEDGWTAWSEEGVARSLQAGRPVFVDFTAAWCISCQVNKKLVLERNDVRAALKAAGVVLLRADWTKADPLITAALARHGRTGVPLYLYYPAGSQEPRILPEILTAGLVLDAVQQ